MKNIPSNHSPKKSTLNSLTACFFVILLQKVESAIRHFKSVENDVIFHEKPWWKQKSKISSMYPTSSSKSTYELRNGNTFHVGDIIHIGIIARDTNGRLRVSGGDFFFATLSSFTNPKASISGKIVDYDNGTYSVYFLAAWSGQAEINITLVHSSEATNFLKDTAWNQVRVQWTAIYTYKAQTADTLCEVVTAGTHTWKDMCEYPNPQALGKTSFMCQRIKGFPCSSITHYGNSRRATSRMLDHNKGIVKGHEHLFLR